jgi:exopolyphosphatase/guanosine-5'-triphosphate,3'-diphosphate pyrophosphatase
MKVAAIDLGANTILCLIAEVSSAREILPLYQHTATTRLGDFSNKNELTPEAIHRSLNVLQQYKKRCADYQVEKCVIVATSVLRDANRRDYFCNLVKTEIGVPIEILNAETEAELSYRGALSNKKKLHGQTLVCDIGGGSTEFVIGNQARVTASASIPVGALKLTKKFCLSDPPLAAELASMRHWIKTTFFPIDSQFRKFKQMIGVGGTVTTLAAINAAAADYLPEEIDGSLLDLSAIQMLLKKLISLPLEKRKKVVGLTPDRADIIISGTVLLVELLTELGAEKIIVSDRCLRYGVILKMII